MTQSAVEKLLGKPRFTNEDEAYYGETPRIEKGDSLPSPTSIVITYSSSGVVESKAFFGNSERKGS